MESIGFLAKANKLLGKLAVENPIHKQLENYIEHYTDSENYLKNTRHCLAFIGNVGVGKTSAICSLLNLFDDAKPVLSVGSGRTTLCEVEVKCGETFCIDVTPSSEEEVRSYVKDFSHYLLSKESGLSDQDKQIDSFKLSVEVERVLRNMLDLNIERPKKGESKQDSYDPAFEFVGSFSGLSEVVDALMERIDLGKRKRTMFLPEPDADLKNWLRHTFRLINSGAHPEVGLAKKIAILLPENEFQFENRYLRIVDTKGVDQTVNRFDLDDCLTDDRTICVVCTKFGDAPDKTMISFLENAKLAGVGERISVECVLLVLDREGEAEEVFDVNDHVDDKDEGRAIRREHIKNDLKHKLRLEGLDIQFIDAKSDKPVVLRQHLEGKVAALRSTHSKRLREIEAEVANIELEINSQSVYQAKERVKVTLEPWLRKALNCNPEIKEYFIPLIDEISNGGVAAASVMASVNRQGEWHNLDYYQDLASGARQQIVEQLDSLKIELMTLINNLLSQNEMQPAYALLKQLKMTTDKRLGVLYQQVFSKGRAVYEPSLKADALFWSRMEGEWGMGGGYKKRIAVGSQSWFQNNRYPDFENAVSQKAKESWERYLEELQQLLGVAY